ncbi:MAG: hypothetical protein JW763_00400 [candidate division Zixibacteria bacterium]|nr:hypothetical protein [candidate division Zixibacteria bacterium]
MRLCIQSQRSAVVAALFCALLIAAGPLTAHAQASKDCRYLAAEPSQFTFNLNAGDSILGESLYVYEEYGDTIAFITSTGYGSEWLEVDTMTASPLLTPEIIFVNVSTAGLDPGWYVDTISITSQDACNNLSIPVTLHVEATETILQYSPDYFYVHLYQGETYTDSLYVSEMYGGAVSFNVAVSESWLIVDAPGYSPPYTTPIALDVEFDVSTFATGVYTDSIIIMPTDPAIPSDTIPVTVIMYDEPRVIVVPEMVEISLSPGQMAQLQSFFVYEEHGDNILFRYTKTQGSSWLYFHDSLPYGTTPDSVVYDIYAGDLDPGLYIDTVCFFSDTDGVSFPDIYVPVQLTVEAVQPQLMVNPFWLNLRGEPGDTLYDSLYVYEASGLPMTFDAVTYIGSWLSIPEYPTPVPTPGYIPLTIITDGLPIGEYYDTVEVHGYDNSPFSRRYEYDISVRLVVDTAGYSLRAIPAWLEFSVPENTIDTAVVTVVENNGANVECGLSNKRPWLTLPLFVTAPVTPFNLSFWINTDSLPVGTYYDTITVIPYTPEAGTPLYIPVSLTVTAGDTLTYLATMPLEFYYTLDVGDQGYDTLHVYDVFGQSINFWTYNYSSWLYVDTMTASPLFTPEDLPIIINTDGLAPGPYADSIILDTYDASNTPIVVPVYLTVQDDDSLTLLTTIPEEFFFTLNAGGQAHDTLHVFEMFGRSVDFWTYNFASWLDIDTMAITPLYTPEDIPININTDGLLPGNYSDSIVIYAYDADNSPLIVPVTLTVVDDSVDYVVRAAPTYLRFYLDPGEVQYDSLLIYEIHDATIPFHCEWDASWFEVLGTYQSPFNTPEALFVRATDSGLTSGIHTDTLFIIPESIYFDTLVVPISVVVGETVPVVIAEPNLFTFNMVAGDSARFNYTVVYEQSGMNLFFDVATSLGSDWLVIEPSGSPRITHDSVFFSIYTEGLADGIYRDTMIIYDPLDDTLTFADVKIPVILAVTGGQTEFTVLTDPESFSLSGFDDLIFRSLYVYEENGATVPFAYYNLRPWVWVNYDDTLLQQTDIELWVHVAVDSLPAGMYYDTIFIVPNSVWFDTVAVPIELLVAGFPPGDLNHDGAVNLLDILYLILYLYMHPPGAAPSPISMGDVNGDGTIDLLDILYLIEYLYGDPTGPAPVQYY